MRAFRLVPALGAFLLSYSVMAAPPPAPVVVTPIALAHQLDEERAARLEPLIERFNAQNKDARIELVRRVEGAAPKQLNLVTNEEYARFLANKVKFKPLHEVMRDAKEKFDASQLSPELRVGLTDAKGRLFALPVAFSTPVLYINKAAFRKAGLNPEVPPRTWKEVQNAAGKIIDSGGQCPFTTSWPAWVHIDNLSAWNAAEVSDAKGMPAFNGLVQVKHVALLSTWHVAKYFRYFGRRDEADHRFAEGACGMLTSSSSLAARLADNPAMEFGVSPLPYYDDAHGAPLNTLADGSSLWVADGLKPAEYKAVAKFITYILGPEVQLEITIAGGYLPMTPIARAAAASKVLKSDMAGLQVAYSQLQGKPAQPALRVSQLQPLRIIVEEELENAWEKGKPAKEALDNAVQRGTAVMATSAPAASRKK